MKLKLVQVFLLKLVLTLLSSSNSVYAAPFAHFSTHIEHRQLCKILLSTDVPVLPPSTKPTEKPKPQILPDELPTDLPRIAPDPFPDREIKPTYDPKNIVPIDLYKDDEAFEIFWKSLSPQIQKALEDAAHKDFQDLLLEYKKLYPNQNPELQNLLPNMQQLSAEIENLEQSKAEELIAFIKKIARDRYGSQNLEKVKSSIEQTPVTPELKVLKSEKVQMPKDKMDFFSSRREIYNLVAQAEGWLGMQEFINSMKKHSALKDFAILYKALDINFRLAQYKYLEADISVQEYKKIPKSKISHGLSLVQAQFSRESGVLGNKQIKVDAVKALTTGVNAWALAHEVYKASFQVSTILEATQRAGLNSAERVLLEDRTNSVPAEIRQGIFGTKVRDQLLSFIHFIRGPKASSLAEDWLILERIFVLPEVKFNQFFRDCFEAPRDQNAQKTYHDRYAQYLLI